MEFIADILLLAGALGAAVYCFVLSRRLNRFNDLEKGVGGAVAVLSAQVDDLSKALESARASASDSSGSLAGLTERAEDVARRLELLVASMHDLPDIDGTAPNAGNAGNAGAAAADDTANVKEHPEPDDAVAATVNGAESRPQQADSPPQDDTGPLFFRHAGQRQ